MKLQFWGTAAAEGIPGIFCGCEICNKARAEGGRFVRARSQTMIDGDLLIDFGPDTYSNSVKYGYDLSKLGNLLVTHSHMDHLYAYELFNRQPGYCHNTRCEALNIYGSGGVRKALFADTQNKVQSLFDSGKIAFHTLEEYVPATIGEYTVIPVPANHGTEQPFVYIIEKHGKCIFYMTDSNRFTDEINERIASLGKKFDVVVYDCTFGTADTVAAGTAPGHMAIPVINIVRNQFRQLGLYKPGAIEIIDHFSHNGENVSYDALEPLAEKEGLITAYDGLVIEF